jgi:protein-tyrosine-phosphatase
MSDRIVHVLFLCTGNSARSIMAEAVLNQRAPTMFKACSAGSHPKGLVHPYALDVLQDAHYSTAGLHSKSWETFTAPDAPPIDVVITLCDDAANESCPLWPGQPVTAHWGLPDPAAVEGSEDAKRRAFVATLHRLERRLDRLARLPIAALDRDLLHQQLAVIGQAAETPGGSETLATGGGQSACASLPSSGGAREDGAGGRV